MYIPPEQPDFTDFLDTLSATHIVTAYDTNSVVHPYQLSPSFAKGGTITLWMNYSPCAEPCARLLYALAVNYPALAIYLHYIQLYKCSALYPNDKLINVPALQKLNGLVNVQLSALTDIDYKLLFGIKPPTNMIITLDENNLPFTSFTSINQ